ncbi:MAG TPA: hypothetical protein VN700_15530 [Vicinamibacterales bacterium]|nr:hypothetical protein [Vicinamibacterales bacterium]
MSGLAAQVAPEAVPAALSNADFWKLSVDLSEPAGSFRSENLVSNEHTYQYVLPELRQVSRPGGVYMGVAPDQNFTYIIATRPRIAFIVDIRRGNLLQHLMYKAVFELSDDRADFVSRLFSKPRPAGIKSTASVTDLFAAYAHVATSDELYRRNLRAIVDHLTKSRGFALSAADLEQLETIYFAFFWQGPALRYSTIMSGFNGTRGGGGFPTYEEMILQTDMDGTAQSYLASEDNFRFIKSMEEKNLIIPVMGNFAGPKAIRAVGRWARARAVPVSAFYVSNVEQYLFQDGLFEAFAKNVAALPVDDRSTFIRSVSARFGYGGSKTWTDGRATALYPIRAFNRDFQLGLLRSYFDVNSRSR